jgi:hypothetical protein
MGLQIDSAVVSYFVSAIYDRLLYPARPATKHKQNETVAANVSLCCSMLYLKANIYGYDYQYHKLCQRNLQPERRVLNW